MGLYRQNLLCVRPCSSPHSDSVWIPLFVFSPLSSSLSLSFKGFLPCSIRSWLISFTQPLIISSVVQCSICSSSVGVSFNMGCIDKDGSCIYIPHSYCFFQDPCKYAFKYFAGKPPGKRITNWWQNGVLELLNQTLKPAISNVHINFFNGLP